MLIVLWYSSLSARYYKNMHEDKKDFEILSEQSLQKIWAGWKLFQSFSHNKVIKDRTQRKLQDFLERIPNPKQRNFLSFFILDEEKNIILESLIEEPKFKSLHLGVEDVFYVDEGTMIRVSKLHVASIWKQVVFYKSLRYSQSQFFTDILIFTILCLFLAVVVYLVGYSFVGRVLQPVRSNLQDMKDFVHNAWHELKTPLAILRGNMQVMQSEKKFDKKLLDQNVDKIDESNQLIERLIELSDLWKEVERWPVQIKKMTEKIFSDFSEIAKEKGVRLSHNFTEKIAVHANAGELEILLSNLIKNAIKYNKEWWKVELVYEKGTLEVRDTGMWIKKQEQERIFDRFYRGSKVRSEQWFWIGLSLVKKIVEKNAWRISLKSRLGEWTSFFVRFKR